MLFGAFLKYEVLPVVDESTFTSTVSASTNSVSASAIMMTAQRDISCPRLPDRLEKDTMTRKEKLYNDVIGLLEKYNLSWNGKDAAATNGVRLVKLLVECLWYLDGRYHIFEKQGYVKPKFFTNFSGYNVPEASKHRKQALDNICDCLSKNPTSSYTN